jgi:hypothetical protein
MLEERQLLAVLYSVSQNTISVLPSVIPSVATGYSVASMTEQNQLSTTQQSIYGPLNREQTLVIQSTGLPALSAANTSAATSTPLAAAQVTSKPKVSIKAVKSTAYEHDEYQDYLSFEVSREATNISYALNVGIKLTGTAISLYNKPTGQTTNSERDYSIDALPREWLTEYYDRTSTIVIATIPANSNSVMLKFPILNNAPDTEPDETLIPVIQRSQNSAYTIGTKSATGTIKEIKNEPLLVISTIQGIGYEIGTNAVNLPEGINNTLIFQIIRYGNTKTSLTCSLGNAPGATAIPSGANADVKLVGQNPISFAAEEKAKLVFMDIIDDSIKEPTETLLVAINPGTGYHVISGDHALATIYDNDTPSIDGKLSTTLNIRTKQNGEEAATDAGIKHVEFEVERVIDPKNPGILYQSLSTVCQLTVSYKTSPTGGYLSSSILLTKPVVFQAGETTVIVPYNIINDDNKYDMKIEAKLVKPSFLGISLPTGVDYKIGIDKATAMVKDRVKPKVYANKVVVYVDTKTVHHSFNRTAVQSHMQSFLDSKSINCQIILQEKAFNSVQQNTLGLFDTVPNATNPGFDEFRCTLDFGYIVGEHGYGYNGNKINVRVNGSKIFGEAKDVSICYANVLLHEIFWHGILGKKDPLFGNPFEEGYLECGTAWTGKLINNILPDNLNGIKTIGF